jgi:hypothetical protein
MSKPIIDLAVMPYDAMLVLAHPSGVVYRNQVGGVTCFQKELEGVLGAVDLGDAEVERIMNLPFAPGHGVSVELADALDAILTGNARTRHVTVDRARLRDSLEAWVFVHADTREAPPDHRVGDYFGSIFGFGKASAVLTWPNSD